MRNRQILIVAAMRHWLAWPVHSLQHVVEMGKAKLWGEAVGTTEGLSGEHGQVVDVLWLAGAEEWLSKESLRILL